MTQARCFLSFQLFCFASSSRPDGEIMNLTETQLEPQPSNPLRVKTNMASLWWQNEDSGTQYVVNVRACAHTRAHKQFPSLNLGQMQLPAL